MHLRGEIINKKNKDEILQKEDKNDILHSYTTTSKDLNTFEWACDEVYQNSDEKLEITIGSIPIIMTDQNL